MRTDRLPAEDPWLEELAQRIADGESSDWNENFASARPEDLPILEALLSLDRLMSTSRSGEGDESSAVVPFDPNDGEERRTWAHLELRESLGRGAYGTVYRAVDPLLEREVALKLVDLERLAGGMTQEEVLREGRLLAKIDHPNVVTVYGASLVDGLYGVWMELIRGNTLEQTVKRRGAFGATEACLIGSEVARGASAIHAQGILHRDIKASNVMRQAGGRIVLMDLGIGLPLDESPDAKPLGTPLYTAPEVLAGEPASVASDVYAMGVLLFYLVTGRYPVEAPTLEELRRRHRDGRRLGLRDARPDLDRGFVEIIETALDPEPEKRFGSMGELEAALGRRLSSPDVSAAHGTVSINGGVVASSSRVRAIALAGLLSLALIASGVYWWQARPKGLPEGTRLLLGEVENLTLDPELDHVRDVVQVQLNQSPHYSLVTQTEVDEARQRMSVGPSDLSDGLREIGWRTGALAVVTGSLSKVGERYRLSLRLEGGESPVDTDFLAAENFDGATKDSILRLIDDGSRWIRREVGEAAESVQLNDVPARNATSWSWRAIDLYQQGLREDAAGRWHEAADLYQRALAIDPQFARVHAALGMQSVWMDLPKAYAHWDRALEAIEEGRLTRKEGLILESQIRLGRDELDEALQASRKLRELFPEEFRGDFYYAMSLWELGRPEEAKTVLEEALTKWPSDPFLLNRYCELLVSGGRPGWQAAVLELERRHGAQPQWAAAVASHRGLAALLEQDWEAAQRFFEDVTSAEAPAWKSRGYSMVASTLAEAGRAEEAERVLVDGILYDASQSGLDGLRARKHLAVAFIAIGRAAIKEAVRHAEEAVVLSSDPRILAAAASIFAAAGASNDIEELLNKLPDSEAPVIRTARQRLTGELEISRGRMVEGVERMRLAADSDLPNNARDYLALAFERAGLHAEADQVYRQILSNPAAVWWREQIFHTRPGLVRLARQSIEQTEKLP